MARQNYGLIGKGEKFGLNGVKHDGPGASREIRPADSADKKRVARKNHTVHMDTDSPRRVAWSMKDLKGQASYLD